MVCWGRTSRAAGECKNSMFLFLSLPVTNWNGTVCANDFTIKTCEYSNTFYIIVYPTHWIDPLISFFRRLVCVFVNRSVVERLRPQFLTDFHEILHAAQKCGRFVAYCL